MQQPVQQVDTGYATFYAASLHGRRTASGERFDNHALMAAHPSLPFGSIVRVTNLANQRSVDVRIVDRGPSAEQVKQGYVIDLSRAAAARLRMRRAGRVRVRIEVMRVGPE